jgi:hypothetical protein
MESSSLFGTIYTYLFSETQEENQPVHVHRRTQSVDRVVKQVYKYRQFTNSSFRENLINSNYTRLRHQHFVTIVKVCIFYYAFLIIRIHLGNRPTRLHLYYMQIRLPP